MPLAAAAQKRYNPRSNYEIVEDAMPLYGKVREDKRNHHWYVEVKGQRYYWIPLKGGDRLSCDSEHLALKLQEIISRQIDQGIFRPERGLFLKEIAWIEIQK